MEMRKEEGQKEGKGKRKKIRGRAMTITRAVMD